ncbi:MAG: hypothetical protein RI894_2676 [Bacteroidota bacterium]|jgi:toxin YoeB
MAYRTEMRDEFRDALQDWITDNKRIAVKVFDLMRIVSKTPFEGIGKPEPLKHNLSGMWSRRIDQEHRLIYEIQEDNELVIFISCYGHYL